MLRRLLSSLPAFLLLIVFHTPAAAQKGEPVQLPNGFSILSYKESVAGILLNYVEAGKGPPLVFLHGWGGSWKDWADNLPAFAATHRVLAVDFPAFGDSEQLEGEYSIERLTDVVEKFLDRKGLDDVQVVGHSLGGLIALNLAARPNSKVKKLVVSDAVGIGDKAEFLSYAITRKIIGPESRWESWEGVLQDELRSIIGSFFKDKNPSGAREFFESVPKVPFTGRPLLPMTPSVQLTASIIDFDIRPKLASIRQPTLVLWGAKDRLVSPQDASLLHKALPNSRLVIFPNSGHSPMTEEPLPFNEEVARFLQAPEPGAAK